MHLPSRTTSNCCGFILIHTPLNFHVSMLFSFSFVIVVVNKRQNMGWIGHPMWATHDKKIDPVPPCSDVRSCDLFWQHTSTKSMVQASLAQPSLPIVGAFLTLHCCFADTFCHLFLPGRHLRESPPVPVDNAAHVCSLCGSADGHLQALHVLHPKLLQHATGPTVLVEQQRGSSTLLVRCRARQLDPLKCEYLEHQPPRDRQHGNSLSPFHAALVGKAPWVPCFGALVSALLLWPFRLPVSSVLVLAGLTVPFYCAHTLQWGLKKSAVGQNIRNSTCRLMWKGERGSQCEEHHCLGERAGPGPLTGSKPFLFRLWNNIKFG